MTKFNVLGGVVALVAVSTALGQGSINFSSVAVPGRPRITDAAGANVGGTTISVEILAKAPGAASYSAVQKVNTDGSLSAFTPINPLSGNNAGLFSGGTVAVPGIAGGSPASVIVRAWDNTTGASFDAATLKGSVAFDIASLGGAGTPPSTPAIMAGYTGITLVPEPSTYALAALGLGALLYFRRK